MTPFGPATGWWQRAGASIVDGLVLLIPTIIVVVAFKSSVAERIVQFAIQVAYTTAMLSTGGRTVGNMAVGTRVVDAKTGAIPGAGKALGRSLAPVLLLVLLIIPAILDILWPLWDRENQTLHDKMAGTYVIRT
jgi:uncharacterized RDD family membrane protein YckC